MKFNPEPNSLAILDLQAFAKAWVAELVELGISGVRPHDPLDRLGFETVVATLDNKIEELLANGAPKRDVLPLLKIANELRPSNAGDFEGFELALRSLQLTFTASPNPWYDYIDFPISEPHANSYLKRLPISVREITAATAKAYAEQTNRSSLAHVVREAS
ncbi:hypothetical protein [Roseibium aggregatum]|uniref:hypothetical protein n=1 Tax=Roseibium aggregatum TaxID=187304 RepID=UPI0011153413|nr:hypothetical protein [Roseibium aggregatum]UFI04667.1 hypothetical protein ST40_005935 [Roseibium aggregatum]